MTETQFYSATHPALRRVLASATAARAIERTAHRFSHRPLPGQPKEPTHG